MSSAKKPVKKSLPKGARPHMPGYGIPKSSKGLLPWSWAEDRLKKSHNYWISTTKPDGSPHSMVVWGLWRDGAFYFSTGSKSRKAKNLAKNPKCVVCTEKAEQAVIVEGKAQLSGDESLLAWFNKAYQTKYKWDMSGFSEPVYVVRPRVAFGLYEKEFVGSATRWTF